MNVYIGSDHGGFSLKSKIIQKYKDTKYSLTDLGSKNLIPDDDYPDIAIKVAKAVLADESSKGILICRNGVGVCIVANKVSGIRAVNTTDVDIAISSRKDDNANILCLGADYITFEEAINIIERWLNTPFSEANRHKLRIKKIKEVELSSL